MKKAFALGLALVMLTLAACSAAPAATTTTTTTTVTTTTPATVIPPQAKEAEEPGWMPTSGALPEDSVYLIAMKTADLQDSMYIPTDQETWKAAWKSALAGAEPTGEPLQWDHLLPLYLCWHQGDTETALYFAPEGSFYFVKDDAVQKAQGEGAGTLYALALESYQALDLHPIAPEDLGEAESAKLAQGNVTRYLAGAEKLARLTGILAKSHPRDPSGCSFDLLTLTMADGRELQLALANDGCNVWMSDGVYYQLEGTPGSGSIHEIAEMFGGEAK